MIERIDAQGLSLNNPNNKGAFEKLDLGSDNVKTFMKVGQVDKESPAFLSGIETNDLIIQFGPYTSMNIEDKTLKEIAAHVKERENKIILIKVLRKSEIFRLKLTPQKWSGFGLLGCKLNYHE